MSLLDRAFIKAFDAPDGSARPELELATETPTDAMLLEDDPITSETLAVLPAAKKLLAGNWPNEPESLAPLSSFAPPPKIHDACRAMFEVDRLRWPAECDELLARSRAAWDQFVDGLIERSSRGQKCIALSSCARGAGRTLLAITTARHLAARGLRCVLVDADMENPSLAKTCGVMAPTGWGDLLSSELPQGEAMIAAVEDSVTVVPWRGDAVPLGQLANSLRAAMSFSLWRENSDLVIVDAMPLDGQTSIADFARFAQTLHLDALYLVQHGGSTSEETLKTTCAKLRRAGVPLEGIIENFASTTAHHQLAGPHARARAAAPALASVDESLSYKVT